MTSKSTFKKSQPLQYDYLSRVMSELRDLNEAFRELREDAAGSQLATIREKTACIADLAMVHGFDGVEIIAERIASLLKAKQEMTPALLRKLESCIHGLQTVLRIEEFIERRMTVEKVERVVTRGEEKIHAYTRDVFDIQRESTAKDSVEEDDVKIVDRPSLMFDIKDDASVLSLAPSDDTPDRDDAGEKLDSFEYEREMNAGSLA